MRVGRIVPPITRLKALNQRLLGPQPVRTLQPVPHLVPNNAVLADGVGRYAEKAVLVDWQATSEGHPEYFWDGIHLTPEGAAAYATLINSHLEVPEGSAGPPGAKEMFYWGAGGFSGQCVGPPSWCRSVVRS